jgi:glycosyltransferase involved in cell wall biosynthesis
MLKLTAIIPTYNEEDHIEAAIDSVSFADEILVVDSFSTDRTVDLAKAKGARIIQQEYEHSASQKNWAIPQAEHDWIFLLDADERVTPELQAELGVLLEHEPSKKGYWIGRINHYMGKRIRHGGWSGDRVIRLFHRDCRYEEKEVHAEVIVPGGAGSLKNKLEHFTYKNFNHMMEKVDRYTTLGARDRVKNKKSVGLWDLVFKPWYKFISDYFIKLGILDGLVGLILALVSSYYIFLRSVKMWRILEGEEL